MKHYIFITSVLLLIFSNVFGASEVKAYKLNGTKFNYPKNLYYYIDSSIPYPSNVRVGVIAWNASSDVEFTLEVPTSPGIANVRMYYYNTYKSYYAITYHTTPQQPYINYHADWKALGQTQREETAVHEVGHCLGLAHCEEPYPSPTPVMRAAGFNNLQAPLTDDWNGIAAIY